MPAQLCSKSGNGIIQSRFLNYTEEILLVDINYDPKNKVHECRIEKYENEKRLYIQLCSRLQPPPNGCRRLHSCSFYFFYTVILAY